MQIDGLGMFVTQGGQAVCSFELRLEKGCSAWVRRYLREYRIRGQGHSCVKVLVGVEVECKVVRMYAHVAVLPQLFQVDIVGGVEHKKFLTRMKTSAAALGFINSNSSSIAKSKLETQLVPY